MLNPQYLLPDNRTRIRTLFTANPALPSVTLHRFFDDKMFKQIRNRASKSRYTEKRKPMQYFYEKAPVHALLKGSMNENGALQLFSEIIGKKVKKVEGNLIRLGWKHHTLLHQENLQKPGYDVILDLSTWDASWGGLPIYGDGTGNYSSVPPTENALTLTHRKKSIQYFLKYVNHHAKGKRILFLGKLL